MENRWSGLDMEIHEQLVIQGSVGVLTSRLEHHDLKSLHSYYLRHNEYALWEVERYFALNGDSRLTPRQKIKYKLIRWKLFPVAYFILIYFFKGGFLDGQSGFYFAVSRLLQLYQIQSRIQERLLKTTAR